MSTRCLNKASLIGNLTNDPDLRYTPSGVAVCSFGVATNRRWTTQEGEKKESAQFHRIVAWSQLAEICSQLLSKGNRVFVEGRIQYREWTGSDNVKRQTTEIVIEDMILLTSRSGGVSGGMGTGKGLTGQSTGDTSSPLAVAADDKSSDNNDDLGSVVIEEPKEGEGKEETKVVDEKPLAETDTKAKEPVADKEDNVEESKDIPF